MELALDITGGNLSDAADLLHVARSTVFKWVAELPELERFQGMSQLAHDLAGDTRRALVANAGDRRAAAAMLGITYGALQQRLINHPGLMALCVNAKRKAPWLPCTLTIGCHGTRTELSPAVCLDTVSPRTEYHEL